MRQASTTWHQPPFWVLLFGCIRLPVSDQLFVPPPGYLGLLHLVVLKQSSCMPRMRYPLPDASIRRGVVYHADLCLFHVLILLTVSRSQFVSPWHTQKRTESSLNNNHLPSRLNTLVGIDERIYYLLIKLKLAKFPVAANRPSRDRYSVQTRLSPELLPLASGSPGSCTQAVKSAISLTYPVPGQSE